jgi:molybdopterin adenylyltransferase
MSVADHRAHAPASVRCVVVTISDTRTEATDTSGRAIAELLGERGHQVVHRTIVRDEGDDIRNVLDAALGRDGTFEIVSGLLEKPLDGFGELFRMLSYTDIGPAAMLTRACAGLARRKILVSMPGSEAAVRLAMHKLLLPELGHLVREARR